MKIERKNEYDILKNEVDINRLGEYSLEQIKESVPLLDKVMEQNAVSTFDLITLLREKYNGSLKSAYHNASISGFVNSKVNCVYLSRILKEELKKLGIDAHYLSHQARLYALDSGDKKIKEAHVSLIYPAIHNDRIIYTIYDPGLKIPIPITFYSKEKYEQELDNNLSVGIEYDPSNVEYPNAIKMHGISPYSYTEFPHLIYQRFNPNYLIDNLECSQFLLKKEVYRYKHFHQHLAETYHLRNGSLSFQLLEYKHQVLLKYIVKQAFLLQIYF